MVCSGSRRRRCAGSGTATRSTRPNTAATCCSPRRADGGPVQPEDLFNRVLDRTRSRLRHPSGRTVAPLPGFARRGPHQHPLLALRDHVIAPILAGVRGPRPRPGPPAGPASTPTTRTSASPCGRSSTTISSRELSRLRRLSAIQPSRPSRPTNRLVNRAATHLPALSLAGEVPYSRSTRKYARESVDRYRR